MENIQQMAARHEQEIDVLQVACLHPDISVPTPFELALGHYWEPLVVCGTCGAIVERMSTLGTPVITTTDGSNCCLQVGVGEGRKP